MLYSRKLHVEAGGRVGREEPSDDRPGLSSLKVDQFFRHTAYQARPVFLHAAI